ncbi:MAG: hypothetical protein WAU10_09385 [Caldilineaceae bacterium]
MRLIVWIYLQLRYNPLVALFVGGLAVWAVEKIAEDFLRNRGWSGLAVLLIAIVMTLLFFQAGSQLFYHLIPRNQPASGPAPTPRRGMILLLGRAETAQAAAEAHPDLEHLWLIVTAQSNDEMEKLRYRLSGRIVTLREWIHNPYDQTECANAVDRSVSHAATQGITGEDLICDLTGGTVAMTIGAFQACQRLALDTQMVTAGYDKERKHPVPGPVIALTH